MTQVPTGNSFTIAGIPTTYRGLRFRSRLEATWAAFFDLVEWEWQYEPFDLQGYIPDFVLPTKGPLLVEVKPAVGLAELEQYSPKIEASGWAGPYMVVGAGPITCHCGDTPPGHGTLGAAPRGPRCPTPMSRHRLDELWFHAKNATQWRG